VSMGSAGPFLELRLSDCQPLWTPNMGRCCSGSWSAAPKCVPAPSGRTLNLHLTVAVPIPLLF